MRSGHRRRDLPCALEETQRSTSHRQAAGLIGRKEASLMGRLFSFDDELQPTKRLEGCSWLMMQAADETSAASTA
jgi:hypothetical protein